MGVGRSCSVAVGLAEEERPKSADFEFIKVSNSSAAREVRHAVNGGLAKQQIDFMWNEFHDRNPMNKTEIKMLLKKLIGSYPAKYREAIDIAFKAYVTAPNPISHVEVVRRNLDDALAPALKEMESRHAAMSAEEIGALVDQYVDFLKISSTVSLSSFTRSFQHDIGPTLAVTFMGDKYPPKHFASIAKKFETNLLNV